MTKWYLLFLAGGVGTIARYVLSGTVSQIWGVRFPYGTLMVNLLGCFLIGFLAAVAQGKLLISTEARLFLIVGFLGAFTTFSAFIFETANLIKEGQALLAFCNVMVSVIVGFLIFQVGVLLGKMF